MTEEIAKKASELLKEKSKLVENQSEFIKSGNIGVKFYETLKDIYFMSYGDRGVYMNICSNNKVNTEIKELIIKRTQERIEEIDIEMSELNCN